MESLAPQEAGALVVLKDTLVLQDAEVWLVQNEDFNQLLLNIWTERLKDLTTIKEKLISVCGLQVHLDLLVRRVLMVLLVKLDPKDLLVSQVDSKQC